MLLCWGQSMYTTCISKICRHDFVSRQFHLGLLQSQFACRNPVFRCVVLNPWFIHACAVNCQQAFYYASDYSKSNLLNHVIWLWLQRSHLLSSLDQATSYCTLIGCPKHSASVVLVLPQRKSENLFFTITIDGSVSS